jgi:hypothetical protein
MSLSHLKAGALCWRQAHYHSYARRTQGATCLRFAPAGGFLDANQDQALG